MIDQLCDEALKIESNQLKKNHINNSYAVKGYGHGKGTQFSHPRMDYMCLNKAQTAKLKQRCDMYRNEEKVQDAHFSYYKSDHMGIQAETIKEQLKNDGAINSVFQNLEI